MKVDLGKSSVSKIENQNIPGGDYKHFELKPGETCQACIDACLRDPNCKAYTFVSAGQQGQYAVCWLKSSVSSYVNDNHCKSGIKTFTHEGSANVQDDGKPTMSKNEFHDLPGSDYKTVEVKPGESVESYVNACLNDPKCRAVTYVKPGVQGKNGYCWFKSALSAPKYDENCTSWTKSYQAKDQDKEWPVNP
ncbi:MAG: PAN domain-containing protein [Bacteroidetes bacterium]|nr:PAN domain-containing protein [Bacteroidota bacterium]